MKKYRVSYGFSGAISVVIDAKCEEELRSKIESAELPWTDCQGGIMPGDYQFDMEPVESIDFDSELIEEVQ
ncbi:hypothetical protein [Rhodobacteraceae phage LS06-2018-MD06]|jgi:hypothetical protein|nr:hypothetical protein [Rhodobacteraceae phage LS06-2018-MD06]